MERTRVVLREVRQRAVEQELAEQTQVGEALIKGLMRAQLSLALRLAVVVLIGLGGLPLVFYFAPPHGKATILPWLLLGVAAYPFLFAAGYTYVKLAENNERDFSAVVRRDG